MEVKNKITEVYLFKKAHLDLILINKYILIFLTSRNSVLAEISR